MFTSWRNRNQRARWEAAKLKSTQIHPPVTHNFLQPDPNSYMIHNLPKQHLLPENKSSKHEPVRAVSDSIHTTAQLALLPFEHLEHLNLDLVGSDHSIDGQSSTCHMPYPCEEVEEVGILLGLFCVSCLLVLMTKSGGSEVVSLVMTSNLYNVCNPRCSCWQPCARGSFLPVCCPGQPSHLLSLHVLVVWRREDLHINRQGLLFVVTISAYKSLQALPVSSPIPCCPTLSNLFL